MSLTHQQEAFAQAVASGKSQSDAYRAAYPKSLRWKPEVVWSKASTMASSGKVSERITEIKAELAERGLWTREDSARALIAVVQSPDKKSDVVAAVKVLNEMNGFEAPKEFKHLVEGVKLVVSGVKPDDA